LIACRFSFGLPRQLAEHLDQAEKELPALVERAHRRHLPDAADVEDCRALHGRGAGAAEEPFLLCAPPSGSSSFGDTEHDAFGGPGELVAELALGPRQAATELLG
jgi:hypothetical protein